MLSSLLDDVVIVLIPTSYTVSTQHSVLHFIFLILYLTYKGSGGMEILQRLGRESIHEIVPMLVVGLIDPKILDCQND